MTLVYPPTHDDFVEYLALRELYRDTGIGWGDDHAMERAAGSARETIRKELHRVRLRLLTHYCR